MGQLFSSVLLGLALGAPVGPVNAAQISRGLTSGFFPSWFIGLGALTADIFYMVLVYIGVLPLIQLPPVKAFLWSFGCFVLLYTGVESIVQAGRITRDERAAHDSLPRAFAYGFMISIANPLTILFWLGIYGSLVAKSLATTTGTDLLLHSLAVIFGLVLWDVGMAFVASSFRHLLSRKELPESPLFPASA